MESLPLEMVLEVAQYLSTKDISACCAVSSYWRHMFGTDEVWKLRCDVSLEEHLRTTPCVVEPVFSSPLEDNSTLSPISKWRMAFMRENHLRENWRNGNYKKVEHTVEQENMKVALDRFVTNDFIVSFYLEFVELWDVRRMHPVSVAKTPLYNHAYHVIVTSDLVVTVDKALVQVMKVDLTEGSITTNCMFNFFEEEKLSEDQFGKRKITKSLYNKFVKFPFPKYTALIGKNLLGFDQSTVEVHVWDLESGTKLKSEPGPPVDFQCELEEIVYCKTSEDVLVVVEQNFNESGLLNIAYFIFNGRQLKYLPFRQVLEVYYKGDCTIINSFISVSFNFRVRVYNYRTSETLLELPVCSGFGSIGDSFLFIIYDRLHLFCPQRGNVKVMTDLEVEGIKVIGEKHVEVTRYDVGPEVWKINRSSQIRTGVTLFEFKEINQACTRLIMGNSIVPVPEESISVLHFW